MDSVGVRVDLDAAEQRDLVVDRHAGRARLLDQGHRLIGIVRPDLEVRVVAVDAGYDQLGRRHHVLGEDGADQGLAVDRRLSALRTRMSSSGGRVTSMRSAVVSELK